MADPVGSSVPGDTETTAAIAAASKAIHKARAQWPGIADELARVAVLAAAPLLVSAEAERPSERVVDLLARNQRLAHDVEGLQAALRSADAVVEGLRTELAGRDAELAHLIAQLRHAVRVDEWQVPPKDTAEIVSVAMETLAKHWACGDGL